jgi:hypothetical protein
VEVTRTASDVRLCTTDPFLGSRWPPFGEAPRPVW